MSKKKKEIRKQQRKAWHAEKGRRKKIRHNTAANQEKHRIDWQPLVPDAEGQIADQRIMPLDERDRREAVEAQSATALQANLDDAHWQAMADETPFLLGKVVEVSRGLCRAEVNGDTIVCDVRGILTAEGTGYSNIFAVGDRVLLRPLSEERGLVEGVLPRRSGLARADSFDTHLKQILAANVDQLLVVAAWLEPKLWLQLIDEYLIGAQRNGLETAVCLNKIDLAKKVEYVEAIAAPYRSLGIPVFLASAAEGVGIEPIRGFLGNKTTVLAGLSGVGKSTLLNAVQPGLQLRTSEVSNLKSREGRHTTTQAIMLPLEMGGSVIDTPGIKDMGLLGLHPEDLIGFYPDLADVVGYCRFNDCTHSHEPGCAVKDAVADGRIAQWRYDNYVNLYDLLAAES
ncbi:ribosome small subunit-dependent GTPase A [Candidatus Leptofilum sp.]|uniref:ribosome small subunit-dependent GTPase A n=1 Tax=Candidatus Leptofilum sp. TaxID=3241576 RepID=UPI003B5ACC7C